MKRFVALCIVAVAFATAPAFSESFLAIPLDKFHENIKNRTEIQNSARREAERRARFRAEMLEAESVRRARDATNKTETHPHHTLGMSYINGDGVPQSYKEAMKWFMSAAEQGFAKSQNNLGVMYRNGWNTRQDYVRAYMWLKIAALNGSSHGVEGRNSVIAQMTTEQIRRGEVLVRECLAKSYKGC